MKRILGGKRGNSGGKVNRALKMPPSLDTKIRVGASTGRNEYILESIRRAAIGRSSSVSKW